MKKLIHLLLFLNIINLSKAQNTKTGINELFPKANLHIEANDNINPEIGAGILIPNFTIFPTITPGNLQYGMLVFRSETSGSGLDGFYYWDAPNETWEYIVSNNIQEIDLNKTVALGTAFSMDIASGNTNYVKMPFTVVDSPKASYFIDGNGDLNIGQTGRYYISFTGGVEKPNTGQNFAEGISTAIFINDVINPTLVSRTVFASVLNNSRSVTFAISRVINFEAGDRISLRTQRRTALQLGTLKVNSPFTITVSYLD